MVINIQYLLKKTVLDTKYVSDSQGGGARNLITLVSGAFLFMDKSEHFILVLLCKTNLEYREIF